MIPNGNGFNPPRFAMNSRHPVRRQCGFQLQANRPERHFFGRNLKFGLSLELELLAIIAWILEI